MSTVRRSIALGIFMMSTQLVTACFITPTRGGLAVVGIRPGVVVYSQPPPPRQTIVVRPNAPGPRATWVEGHWQWDGRQHVWVEGYWVGYRENQRYVGPHWERQGNGWVYYEGYYAPMR